MGILKGKHAKLKRFLTLTSAVTAAAAVTGCRADKAASSEKESSTGSAEQIGARTAAQEPPNVVYILLDNMGFSDIGAYGGEISTPNIDKLVERGLKYTNFTTTPLSSPTRAALLSGSNSTTVGIASVAEIDLGEDIPSMRGRIMPQYSTISQILQGEGFSTYAVGKWHLTPTAELSPAGPMDNWPLGKGFNNFYGFMSGFAPDFYPELVKDNSFIETPLEPGYHIMEDLTDNAIGYILNQQNVTPDRPFFMYFATGTAHIPYHTPQEYMAKYKGVYDIGWDAVRDARFTRQKELGIFPENLELPPRDPQLPYWEDLTEDQKRIYARYMESYAGYIEYTDAQIGRFLDFLDEMDLTDETLIVLASDNGACAEGGYEGSISHTEFQNIYELSFEDKLEKYDLIGGPDTHAVYPIGWGAVGNTPFRDYMQSTYFGGIRTFMTISWPGKIPAGEIRDQYTYVADITPTVLDLLDIDQPRRIDGIKQEKMEGESFRYTIDDPEAGNRKKHQMIVMGTEWFYWKDGWSLVKSEGGAHTEIKEKVPLMEGWELYHTDEDTVQAYDLAAEHPWKTRMMQAGFFFQAFKTKALTKSLLDFANDWAAQGKSQLEMFRYYTDESIINKDHFKYYPGTQHLNARVFAPLQGVSHRITVPVIRNDEGDEGILVAFGGVDSGFVFYVKDSKLVYEFNFVQEMYSVKSEKDVPVGYSEAAVEITQTDFYDAVAALYIDGEKVGEAPIRTLPVETSSEGADIGRDSLSRVSGSYTGEFPFTGEIINVFVDLKE